MLFNQGQQPLRVETRLEHDHGVATHGGQALGVGRAVVKGAGDHGAHPFFHPKDLPDTGLEKSLDFRGEGFTPHRLGQARGT